MKKLTKKIVLVTGATSGIGKATARVFAKRGYDLVITGRRGDKLKEVRKNFEDKYATKVTTLKFDVMDRDAVSEALQKLKSKNLPIDILINNAGLAVGKDLFHQCNIDDWERMIDTNIKGLLYVSRLVAADMADRKSGHIINVCSTAGHDVYSGGNVYCASKHAVNALTKAMRIDLYDKNIRISQISPGAVEETEFSEVRFKGDKVKAKIYNDFNPVTAKDVAKAIYFMASQPKHVNIQEVVMMGVQQASATLFDKSGRRFD